MSKLLTFIFIFILGYYLLSKYIFPLLVRMFVRKAQQKFQQHQQASDPVENKKEGEVKINYIPPDAQKSKFNPNTEDVDFEEVDDK